MPRILPSLLLPLLLIACGTRSSAPSPWAPTALVAPGDLRGEVETIASVRLQWSAARGARSYIVEMSVPQGTWETVGESDSTSLLVDGLEPFSWYRFRVRSRRDSERSDPGPSLDVHTHRELDGFPSGLPERLDITTWNVQHFPKNGFDTVEEAGRILDAMGSDLIALQEMEDAASFETMLDFAPAYDFILMQDAAYSINTALLFDPGHIEVLEHFELFTNDILAFPRPALTAHVQFDGGTPFWVIVVHYKCCGDGFIDEDSYLDEELRRLHASQKLATWVHNNHPGEAVVILGDFNDAITDVEYRNVFTPFFEEDDGWFFADMSIAEDDEALWSYPSWPSHLDHILLSGPLAPAFDDPSAAISVIPLFHYFFGAFEEYEELVSDHLPVTLTLPLF